MRGADFCGHCAAKRGRFFVRRSHLVCIPAGVPVAFDLFPGGLHDPTPVHALTAGLPAAATVHGDTGYNAATDEATILAEAGGRLVPVRKADMRPNDWADKPALREYRQRIEARYSQREAMGRQRLRARTNPGLERRAHASLLAATITNAD